MRIESLCHRSFVAVCSIVSLVLLHACGGGSGSSPSPVPTPTPDANIAGNYTLQITASDACASQLPAAARVTQYSAAVTQTGTTVAFNAVGSVGTMPLNQSTGTVSGNTVSLQMAFAEQRNRPLYIYQLTATGTGNVQGSSIGGTLNGLVSYVGTNFAAIQCSATDHRFEFTRK